jgi:hypothetical protein
MITRQSFWRLMIFVAWLYEAHIIVDCLDKSSKSSRSQGLFSFATYLILKTTSDCIESHMKDIFVPGPNILDKPMSIIDLAQAIQMDIINDKQHLHKAEAATHELVIKNMKLSECHMGKKQTEFS